MMRYPKVLMVQQPKINTDDELRYQFREYNQHEERYDESDRETYVFYMGNFCEGLVVFILQEDIVRREKNDFVLLFTDLEEELEINVCEFAILNLQHASS